MKRLSRFKNPIEEHSSTVQMFLTTLIMEITTERFILLVIVFAAVIDARVSKNIKVRKNKTNNHTIIDADKESTPTKRDIEILEEIVTINEPVIYNNNISGVKNNKAIDLTELLQNNLKALIGKDDATKLEFIKNIKDMLGINSYENKEDDAIEALRGENAEYAMEISAGRRSFNNGNFATKEITGHGLPKSLPLFPATVYRTALRSLLNQRRFNRLFVNHPKVYPTLLEVLRTPTRQAKWQNGPKQNIQATIQENHSYVQQLQPAQPLQAMLSLPLQNIETETVFLMNHQEIQNPVFDSSDNAYPYEPFIKQ